MNKTPVNCGIMLWQNEKSIRLSSITEYINKYSWKAKCYRRESRLHNAFIIIIVLKKVCIILFYNNVTKSIKKMNTKKISRSEF